MKNYLSFFFISN